MKRLSLKMTAAEWHATLALSDELWPDPTLAPDVPSKAVLEDYLKVGPKAFQPLWLREQIEESPTCQSALEDLRLHHQFPENHLANQCQSLLEKAGFRIGKSAPPPMPERAEEFGPVRLGELRRTREMVSIFDGYRLNRRQTFRPLLVAVVEGPLLSGDQEFSRAVVCTPASGWPEEYFSDDEILVRSDAGVDYVAHLWLEFPVAAVQFGSKVAQLAPLAFENLQFARSAIAEGLPLVPELPPHSETMDEDAMPLVSGFRLDASDDAEALEERRRLHECASWLSATLDAKIAYESWQVSIPKAPESVWDQLRLAGARDRGVSTQFVTWHGPLAGFLDAINDAKRSPEIQESSAECILNPVVEDDGESCRAQWIIPSENRSLEGRHFAVFDPGTVRLIGSGTIVVQGTGLPLLAELDSGLWKDFQMKRVETLILLIPTEW